MIFQRKVRFFWSSNSIFFRFDIIDDNYIPSVAVDPDQIDGDFIRINLAHLTCGPDRNSVDSWSVVVLPNTENESCNLLLNVNSETTRTKIGKIEGTVFRTIEGYSIIVKFPYEKWDDLPRRGGMTRLQIVFGDSDSEGNIDHKFVLFPISRDIKNIDSKISRFGNIRYAEDTWVSVYPRDMVYAKRMATFFIDVGNLTDRERQMRIYPETPQSEQSSADLGQENQVTYNLPAKTVKQKIPIELNFEGLPSSAYRINAKSGVFYDSGAFVVKYVKESGLIYCQKLIDRRKRGTTRDLSIFSSNDLIKSTFSHLAGGGQVLWNVGKYDASSTDFPQYIRKLGDHVIDIPNATEKEVPWAVFGGLDTLDGMNEPLILKFNSKFSNHHEKLSPDEPLSESKTNPSRVAREKYKYLLLLGVIVEYIDEDSFPELHVSTATETLLTQTVRPTSYGGTGKKHVYVFRIWLSSLSSDIRIKNQAIHGPKFEIDFIALLGGGDASIHSENDSSLSFSGTREAKIFTKQVATSKFLLKHYSVDANGKAYSSLPGGRYDGVNLRDWGLLTSELAAWGCLDQASALVKKLPLVLGSVDISPASKGFTVGNALIVNSVYNTWKKLGKSRAFLDPIWLSCVHLPLTELRKEVETNPLRLANCGGEFGAGDPENPAVTLPMYFAVQAALASGVAMAKESGYTENADNWKLTSDRLEIGFRRNLISSENQIKLVSQDIFPESWGIEEQQGIMALLPKNTWVYGRYLDTKSVFYNDRVRVFDTPYLLSGIPFWSDYNGFLLSKDTDQQLKASFDYILGFSPLFRKGIWSKLYMVDYNKSVLQLWTVMSAFLLDSIPIATNMLVNYVRFSFDEFVPIPKFSDIEISPYTFEEKLNASEHGENKGATFDDLNILTGVTGLKTARLIAGIDDYDSSVLRLFPRLPEGWSGVNAKNWLVSHASTESRTSKIEYSYEKVSTGRYIMTVESTDKLSELTVRIGPFSPKTKKVRISGAGDQADVSTFRHGFYAWVTRTFKNVKSLDIAAQATAY